MKPWATALAYALTGEALDLPESETPEPTQIVAALADRGWDAARLQALAVARREAESVWPFPPQAEVFAKLQAPAAYLAALGECVALVGATGRHVAVLADRPLNPDEQRLMSDVPPHFGHAG